MRRKQLTKDRSAKSIEKCHIHFYEIYYYLIKMNKYHTAAVHKKYNAAHFLNDFH